MMAWIKAAMRSVPVSRAVPRVIPRSVPRVVPASAIPRTVPVVIEAEVPVRIIPAAEIPAVPVPAVPISSVRERSIQPRVVNYVKIDGRKLFTICRRELFSGRKPFLFNLFGRHPFYILARQKGKLLFLGLRSCTSIYTILKLLLGELRRRAARGYGQADEQRHNCKLALFHIYLQIKFVSLYRNIYACRKKGVPVANFK